MKRLFVLAALLAMPAFAGVEVQNNSGVRLGNASKLKCGASQSCSVTNGVATVLAQNQQVAASTTALTSSQCGSTVYNSGAVAQPLPLRSTVSNGCRFTFITRAASNFDVDPNAVDLIAALTNAAGDMVRNATVGNSVTLDACGVSEWCATAIYGTWSDAN